MTRQEINRRYREKLKADPKRWEEHQRKMREYNADPRTQELKRKSARERWAKLPPDHPRKNRGDGHTKEAYRRKRRKEHETLPDHVVANRYLHLKVTECPKEVIDLKREQIRLNRELNIRPNTL